MHRKAVYAERDAALARVAELEAELAQSQKADAMGRQLLAGAREASHTDRAALAAERAAHEATKAALRKVGHCLRCSGEGVLWKLGYVGATGTWTCPDCEGTGIHPAARAALEAK
jgi:hypothetical protein